MIAGMTPELLAALFGFAMVAGITPGPNNLMVMTSGVNFGLLRTVPHILGIIGGFTVMILLVGLGLVQLFETFPVTYTVLKVLSVGYLLYLSWKIGMTRTMAEGETASKPFSFLQAAAFQWVNPKGWTMGLTALTAYVPEAAGYAGSVAVAVTFGLAAIPCLAFWNLLGQQMRRFLSTPTRIKVFNITAALLLVATLYPVLFPGGA